MKSNDTNKKKLIATIILPFLLLIPVLVGADVIVPCKGPDCDFNSLMQLVNNIINWILMISFPVAAAIFAWAGFLYMTTAVMDQKTKAKKMIWNVFIGFVIVLSAWLIVTTITGTLLKPEFKQAVPVEGA